MFKFLKFTPIECKLCNTMITSSKKYGIIKYKVANRDDIQEMKICEECIKIIEDSKNESRK